MKNEEMITALAKRIYDLSDPWDREPDLTEEEQINVIFNEINVTPEYIINYLLDIIDNYTA